jgi:hypothetical protein
MRSSTPDREQSPLARHTREGVLAASGKAEARPGDQVDDDARDEHLARPGGIVSPSRQTQARRVRPRSDPPLFRQSRLCCCVGGSLYVRVPVPVQLLQFGVEVRDFGFVALLLGSELLSRTAGAMLHWPGPSGAEATGLAPGSAAGGALISRCPPLTFGARETPAANSRTTPPRGPRDQ